MLRGTSLTTVVIKTPVIYLLSQGSVDTSSKLLVSVVDNIEGSESLELYVVLLLLLLYLNDLE